MSEVIGKIIVLGEAEVVGAAGTFKKRTVVVKSDEAYPQDIAIDFVQDKTTLLDKFKVGDEVKISINIRGNSYNGKYYVSLNGWRIESLTNAAPQQPVASAPVSQIVEEEESSDLPF